MLRSLAVTEIGFEQKLVRRLKWGMPKKKLLFVMLICFQRQLSALWVDVPVLLNEAITYRRNRVDRPVPTYCRSLHDCQMLWSRMASIAIVSYTSREAHCRTSAGMGAPSLLPVKVSYTSDVPENAVENYLAYVLPWELLQ